MPNWTFNTLEVRPMEYQLDNDKEKKEAAKQYKDFIKKSFKKDKEGEEYFTLNGVCPMPKSLMISSGTSTEQGMAYIDWIENGEPKRIDEILEYGWMKVDKRLNQDVRRDEACKYLASKQNGNDWEDSLKEGRMALDNIEEYGFKDWYNWSIHNWGTKWDASDSYIADEDTEDPMIQIQFNTAWSPPIEWLQKATKKYPFLQFTMNVEEESEAFVGRPVAQFGKVCENLVSVDYPSRDNKSAKVLGMDV